jgi:hypothetical protein
VGWLAALLGLDATVLSERWARFEPVLEAGAAPGLGTGRESPESPESPEQMWICGVAEELGVHVTDTMRASIVADWDDRQPK